MGDHGNIKVLVVGGWSDLEQKFGHQVIIVHLLQETIEVVKDLWLIVDLPENQDQAGGCFGLLHGVS